MGALREVDRAPRWRSRGTPEQTLLKLEHIDAAEAINKFQAAFPPTGKGATGGPTYLEAPGGLLVMNASPSELDGMRAMLKQIDVDPLATGALKKQVFELKHADPAEVIPIVETVVAAKRPP